MLLRKTGIRGQQLTIQALVKLSSMVVDLDGRRGEDLLRTQVDLLVESGIINVACTRKESARSGLGDSSVVVRVLRSRISAALETKSVVAGTDGCGLWGSSETC